MSYSNVFPRANIRMEDHETDPKSHVHEHHKLPGHEMDFANVEILDRANTVKKLESKEMPHRILKYIFFR